MESFFVGLSKRQTMLLLTAVTYGGQDSVPGFDFLPPEEAEVLKHRANEILQIAREKRLPLIVNEIKRLVTARRGQLWSADPDKLAAVLARERPALVEVVLRALPAGLTEQLRKRLPPLKVKLVRDVRPEILNIIRWKLEEALTRGGPQRAGFKFSDMMLLKSRELITVLDRMGARALAYGVAGLSDADREGFFNQLPPDQRLLAQKASSAAGERKLNEKDAKDLLDRYGAAKNATEALRNAGAQRVARACLAQGPDFAQKMVERHPGEIGKLLAKWTQAERPKVAGKGDYGRADIVEQLERLAAKGVIDRPVRLPPPPKAVASRSLDPLPGGKVLLPPPKMRLNPESRNSMMPLRDSHRDPIAERQARRAGAASVRMDPIAAREARRSGVPLPPGRRPTEDSNPGGVAIAPKVPAPGPRVSAAVTRPPVLKMPSDPQRPKDGTSLQRAPRVVGRGTGRGNVVKAPPGRGPKDR